MHGSGVEDLFSFVTRGMRFVMRIRSDRFSSSRRCWMTTVLTGRRPVITAGDFNAWAVELGGRFMNQRGKILLEALGLQETEFAHHSTETVVMNN